jgi:hypothetical protein
MQTTSTLQQTNVNITMTGVYKVELQYTNVYTDVSNYTSNELQIFFGGTLVGTLPPLPPSNTQWLNYSTTFNISTMGAKVLLFQGQNRAVAIANIKLSLVTPDFEPPTTPPAPVAPYGVVVTNLVKNGDFASPTISGIKRMNATGATLPNWTFSKVMQLFHMSGSNPNYAANFIASQYMAMTGTLPLLSQTLNFPKKGTYVFSITYCKAPVAPQNSLQIKLDSTVIYTIPTTYDTDWKTLTFDFPILTTGSKVLHLVPITVGSCIVFTNVMVYQKIITPPPPDVSSNHFEMYKEKMTSHRIGKVVFACLLVH